MSSKQQCSPSRSTSTHHKSSSPKHGNKGVSAGDGKKRDRKDRPCDACRRKKSKCLVKEGFSSCAACSNHGQTCTFVEDPKPRKRRVDSDGGTQDFAKRRVSSSNKKPSPLATGPTSIKHEDIDVLSQTPSPSHVPNWQHNGYHVGYTTELEPMLFDISRSSGNSQWNANYQKSDDRNAFLTFALDQQDLPRTTAAQTLENLTGYQAPILLQHFQSEISQSFPIMEDATLSYKRRHTLDPALLCAIYTVSASSPGVSVDVTHVDVQQLEDLALDLIAESLKKPTLSTIQAGLLLMQRSDIDSKTLNIQLVSAAFELGLHLDCSQWQLSTEEKGLRKRLAWAVYMQDQWCSLTNGRPSLISRPNWAVQDLFDEDFEPETSSDENKIKERRRGVECFCEMVALTEILSSILDTFYTQLAIHEYDAAKENATKLILDRAKPIQMLLKEWFTQLPKTLKLEHGQAPSLIGHLHLAYFATEITLHRCIIRSLSNSPPSETYLIYICRGAAKSRLISAMDFVNRLRTDHLQSFWYFPSKVNFALVATFGSLLLATAPTHEEAEFYMARLREYRWTLSVSAKNAGFLRFAIESMESSADLLKSLPTKPKLEELDLRTMPPPAIPKPRLVTVSEASKAPSDADDAMLDAPPAEPIHSSEFQSQNFEAGLTVGWATDAMSMQEEGVEILPAFTFHSDLLNTNTPDVRRSMGPFAGTPFEGLGARNWFDNSHHGSPDAEQMGMLA